MFKKIQSLASAVIVRIQTKIHCFRRAYDIQSPSMSPALYDPCARPAASSHHLMEFELMSIGLEGAYSISSSDTFLSKRAIDGQYIKILFAVLFILECKKGVGQKHRRGSTPKPSPTQWWEWPRIVSRRGQPETLDLGRRRKGVNGFVDGEAGCNRENAQNRQEAQ